MVVALQHLEAAYAGTAALLHSGDVVRVRGFPARTRAGELSLYATQLQLLAPCLHPIPKVQGLRDPDVQYRQRHLGMLANPGTLATLQLRSHLIRLLRAYLHERAFVEVETPILCALAGGANARPFHTRMFGYAAGREGEQGSSSPSASSPSSNDTTTTTTSLRSHPTPTQPDEGGIPLTLRIAPELYLKRLVIGGMDRVFEVGKQFRNEGTDAWHNPEFTTCELYQTHVDLEHMMGLTEALLGHLEGELSARFPSLMPATAATGEGGRFAAPFARVHVLPELERLLGTPLPDPNDLASIPALLALCAARGLTIPRPWTLSRILDKMIGAWIEPACQAPTFLCGHPLSMSPLAKADPRHSGRADRFELFVGGKELVNAYVELNDPEEQRRRFHHQAMVGGASFAPVSFCPLARV